MKKKAINKIYFPPKLEPILYGKAKINVIYGGRSSGKTQSTVIYNLICTLQQKSNTLVFRLTESNIQHTIYATYKKVIQESEIFSKYFKIYAYHIECVNGGRIDFMGIYQKNEGLKGLDNKQYFVIDEAVDLTREDGIRLEGTFARFKDIRVFYLFNPRNRDDYVYDRFITNGKTMKKHFGNAIEIVNINWQDNPFIAKEEHFLKQIQSDRDTMPDWEFQHQWEGKLREMTDSLIFKDKFEVKEFTTPPKHEIVEERFFYGLDWGFSRDPTAVTRSFIKDGCLWVDHEWGGTGYTPDQVPQYISRIPDVQMGRIYTDPARPDSTEIANNQILYNEDGYSYNLQFQSAIKKSLSNKKEFNNQGQYGGMGWIESGIEYLRSFKKIIIHTRCTETADEFRKYSYKTDKHSGEILRDIIDKHNHYIDSLRYAHSAYIKNSNWIAMLKENNTNQQDISYDEWLEG